MRTAIASRLYRRMTRCGLSCLLAMMLIILSACAEGQSAAPATSGGESGGAEPPTELIVSAAASLKETLEEAGRRFEASHPGVRLRFNFGGSGALVQQLEQGAPADLFISAAREPMERLVHKGVVAEQDIRVLLRNSLVLIERKGSAHIRQLGDITGEQVRIVAVGQPETVPAGSYAREALEHVGLWEAVETKAVYAKDVTAVLTYVESGNADAGFVYETDALQSDQVETVLRLDPELHSPIEYPAAVPLIASHPKEAAELLAFLSTDEVKDIFEQAGFVVMEGM